MVAYRYEPAVLTDILIRFEDGQSPGKIAKEVGVGRSNLYTIRDNLELWGQPYPPFESQASPGSPPKLSEEQMSVCTWPFGVELTELVDEAFLSTSRIGRAPTFKICSNFSTIATR